MRKEWFTANELAGLPLLPGTPRGINTAAKRDHWKKRKRAKGKGFEYHISNLPEKTQAHIQHETAKSVVEADPAPAPKIKETQSLLEMKDWKRKRLDARVAILSLIDEMTEELGSQGKAIDEFCRLADAHELPEDTYELLKIAKNKASKTQHEVHGSTIYRWLKDRKSGMPGLAPRCGRPPVHYSWGAALLKAYQNPNKPSIASIVRDWDKLYPGMEGPGSARKAQRFIEKLPIETRMYGRMGVNALRSVQPFVRRSFDMLWPMDVVTVDGHLFKAYVQHPYGRGRFRPEITNYLDIATRRCVGFSAWVAESQYSIWLALRVMVLDPEFGIAAYQYSDNGAYQGEKHRGLLGRIGTRMMFSQPYRAQARGVVERFNSSVWVPMAKRYPTYAGADNDQEFFKKAIKRFDEGKDVVTWGQFVSDCQAEIDAYNNRPHSALNGKTPNEAWAEAVAEGWRPTLLENDALHDLMPYEERTVRRGEVSLPWGRYFHRDLNLYSGNRVRVHYNPTDGEEVIIANLEGQMLLVAQRDGNVTPYIPESQLEHARQQREKARINRLERKIDTVYEQETPVIEAQAQDPVLAELAQASLTQMQAEIEAQPAFIVPDNDPERYELWKQLDAKSTLTEEENAFYQRFKEADYCRNMQELEAEFQKEINSKKTAG